MINNCFCSLIPKYIRQPSRIILYGKAYEFARKKTVEIDSISGERFRVLNTSNLELTSPKFRKICPKSFSNTKQIWASTILVSILYLRFMQVYGESGPPILRNALGSQQLHSPVIESNVVNSKILFGKKVGLSDLTTWFFSDIYLNFKAIILSNW